MTSQSISRLRPVIIAAMAAMLVALIGGLVTDIGPWYKNLTKPSWHPPDWLFAPAWTIIYALIVLAAAKAWFNAKSRTHRLSIISLFSLNGILNILWSLLFFKLQRPDLALLGNVLLWLSVLSMIIAVWTYSRVSSWLLMPYLIWVTFAWALNYSVVSLNP